MFKPEIEVVKFAVEDIITTSGLTNDDPDGTDWGSSQTVHTPSEAPHPGKGTPHESAVCFFIFTLF